LPAATAPFITHVGVVHSRPQHCLCRMVACIVSRPRVSAAVVRNHGKSQCRNSAAPRLCSCRIRQRIRRLSFGACCSYCLALTMPHVACLSAAETCCVSDSKGW
jgi:hypothetical protein